MKQSGVTLLELLVTLTILTILASVALPFTKVSTKRTKEIELRQNLRVIRAAIDAFRLEWARDGDTLIGPACVKNRLSCKDVTGPYGYPKSLDALLGVKLTGEQATVRGTTIRRYLRSIPMDPMTGA
ncbi:MAG: prepilin-type N-terminal cleavage/methylation domain-containing protein, partial [Nitrospira sp.]|nr:prepilin-type N-terminal cleavage/methylation domain-containing protein [Nitrospira sp.]